MIISKKSYSKVKKKLYNSLSDSELEVIIAANKFSIVGKDLFDKFCEILDKHLTKKEIDIYLSCEEKHVNEEMKKSIADVILQVNKCIVSKIAPELKEIK